MMAMMAENPPLTASTPTPDRELRCKKRSCDTLLARVVGVTLVCLDGTRVGPVASGMVIVRKCPRCGTVTRKWM